MNFTVNRREWLGVAAAASASALTARSAEAEPANSPISRFPTPAEPVPVAFLMDDRATVIDFAGPWEALQDAGVAGVPGFHLYTVAPTAAPLRASAGMQIVPDYSLETAPQPKVVVLGAQAGSRTPSETTDAKIAWLRDVQAEADIILSVCTGAFLLARTGLLDGLNSTTHHGYYDDFAAQFPKVRLLRDRRFVDNGKFLSAGGLTSGIDGALHVVARYYGQEAAQTNATYMEHDGTGWLSGAR